MDNVLVTGCAGFIGGNFTSLLLQEGYNVLGIDKLTYASNLNVLENIKQSHPFHFRFLHLDINDVTNKLLQDYKIKTIVNLAAETHVDNSINSPEVFIHSNINGVFNLLECVRKNPNIKFIQVSTDEVYGDLKPGDPPFNINSNYKPSSPYSASKAAAEHLVTAYNRTYKLDTIITNCTNNYGPGQNSEKLIPKILLNISNGEKIPIYGNGKNVRDWIYVKDHCRGILMAMLYGNSGHRYLFGGENPRTNLEIVKMILDIYGLNLEDSIEFVKDRPGHDLEYRMDITETKKKLQWSPSDSSEMKTHLLDLIY